MPRRFLSSLLCLMFVICVGAAPTPAQGVQNEIGDEEYAVYSALVTQIGTPERAGAVLIWHHTVAKNVPLSTQADETVADLIEDFARKNARAYQLANHLKPARPYRLVSEDHFREAVSLPDPVVTLSRVGFNGAKDRALVYVSFGRSEMFRKEHYFVLHKEKAGWRVARKLAVFVPLRPA